MTRAASWGMRPASASALGEGALEVEHRAHERLRRQGLGECVAGEAAADDVHGAPLAR